MRSIHDAHPAFADPLDDAVLPEQIAHVDEHGLLLFNHRGLTSPLQPRRRHHRTGRRRLQAEVGPNSDFKQRA